MVAVGCDHPGSRVLRTIRGLNQDQLTERSRAMSTIITEPTTAHEFTCPDWCQLPAGHGLEGIADRENPDHNGRQVRIHGLRARVPINDEQEALSFDIYSEEFWAGDRLEATTEPKVTISVREGAVFDYGGLCALSYMANSVGVTLERIQRGESL